MQAAQPTLRSWPPATCLVPLFPLPCATHICADTPRRKQGGMLTRFKRNKVTANADGLLVGSIKYSGYKLKEKGVIVRVETVSTQQ